MEKFITLIVVMTTWVNKYVQIHQVVHIKYGQFFAYQLLLIKLGKQKRLASTVIF